MVESKRPHIWPVGRRSERGDPRNPFLRLNQMAVDKPEPVQSFQKSRGALRIALRLAGVEGNAQVALLRLESSQPHALVCAG